MFFNNYNRGLAQDRNKKDCVALFAMLQPITNESNSNSASEESQSDSELMTDKNNKPITESDASRKNFYESLYGFKKGESSAEESEDNNTQNNNGKKKKTKRIGKNSVAEEICIATTHIYWNPKYIDVKMKQIKQVLLHLAQFNPSLRNTILCGGKTRIRVISLFGNID
jgi:hypothetical protein